MTSSRCLRQPNFAAPSASSMGRLVWALSMVVGLAACGTDRPKPSPLETLGAPKVSAKVAWTQRVDRVRFPLAVAVHGTQVVVAGDDGTVLALQGDTGRELWRTRLSETIVAGVGSDGTRAAVVTQSNRLVVLENGVEKWRTDLGGRVATSPLVAGERVFVMGVDRHVHAYDALDGKKIWSLSRPADAAGALGLIHAGVLAPYKNTLLAGQGARLAAIDSLRGQLAFEVPLATPRGTNEVERLSDLVGPTARAGDVVCARSYQAAVGCVNVERGALVWSKSVGGVQAIAGDATLVVGADASDRITAWNTRNGDTLWSHDRLMHRQLGGAALTPKAVVFGDADGQIHLFDRASGATLHRVATDGASVVGAPVWVANTLVVVNRNGAIHGLTID